MWRSEGTWRSHFSPTPITMDWKTYSIWTLQNKRAHQNSMFCPSTHPNNTTYSAQAFMENLNPKQAWWLSRLQTPMLNPNWTTCSISDPASHVGLSNMMQALQVIMHTKETEQLKDRRTGNAAINIQQAYWGSGAWELSHNLCWLQHSLGTSNKRQWLEGWLKPHGRQLWKGDLNAK